MALPGSRWAVCRASITRNERKGQKRYLPPSLQPLLRTAATALPLLSESPALHAGRPRPALWVRSAGCLHMLCPRLCRPWPACCRHEECMAARHSSRPAPPPKTVWLQLARRLWRPARLFRPVLRGRLGLQGIAAGAQRSHLACTSAACEWGLVGRPLSDSLPSAAPIATR